MTPRRLSFVIVFRLFLGLIVLSVGIEPLLHSHPLLPEARSGDTAGSSRSCAACAAQAQQITSQVTVRVSPAVVLYRLITTRADLPTADASLALPSRAPPAVA
jgi:hypothetical protein